MWTAEFFQGFETDYYPSWRGGVRRCDFFRAAILWASRDTFFAPGAAGEFILFENGVFLKSETGTIFSGRNFAAVGFRLHSIKEY